MNRQNPAQQLTLSRYYESLVLKCIAPAFANQFRNVLLRQKVFVKPSNLREHLQVGEVLRLKIFLRSLGRVSRRVKFLKQLAVSRITPNDIHRIRLKQILQRKPTLLLREVFGGLAR